MLTREWFYTGVTRASQRCVVLYTRDGVGNAIGKQAIKGKTLEDKIRSFQEAQKIGLAGASVNVRMPTRRSLSERSEEQSGLTSPMTVPASPQDDRSEEHTSELQSLMRRSYAVFCLKKKKK